MGRKVAEVIEVRHFELTAIADACCAANNKDHGCPVESRCQRWWDIKSNRAHLPDLTESEYRVAEREFQVFRTRAERRISCPT